MGKIEGTSALKEGDRFTLEQWRSWPEGERWELIGGVAYCMSPAPRVAHQNLALSLASALRSFLSGKPCEPFIAPVDVFLPDGDPEISDTVVQPDVLVVCDPEKIHEDGIRGAPAFVAEILSPATTHKDLTQKKAVYERSGVAEYWLVNPDTGSVFVYILNDGKYGPITEILLGDEVRSVSLPGFSWKVELKDRKRQ
jgi:Uma2 family endonuclease